MTTKIPLKMDCCIPGEQLRGFNASCARRILSGSGRGWSLCHSAAHNMCASVTYDSNLEFCFL